jgi:hypothetical protein
MTPRIPVLRQLLLLVLSVCSLVSAGHAAGSAFGLTIITHGYQPEGFGLNGEEPPVWVFSMAEAVRENAGNDVPIYVVRYDAQMGKAVLDWEVSIDTTSQTYSLNSATDIDIERKGGAIVLLNWVLESNNALNGLSTSQLGDEFVEFLFASAHTGHNLAEIPIHLIGHSRGASMNTRIAYDLAINGVVVDQVTSLDARPVGIDEPLDTYANTVFADSYYRTFAPLTPDGDPVPGAFNANLSSFVTGSSGCIEHSEVHAYYYATVDTDATYDKDGCIILTSQWFTDVGSTRHGTGFAYSRYAGPRVSRSLSGSSASGLNELISGAGGTGDRTILAATDQFWPNAFFDQRAFTTASITVGSSVSIPYYFADRNSQQTVSFAVDNDTNPFNNSGNSAYQAIGSTTHSARVGGSIGAASIPWTPSAAQTGLRYLQIKTTNGTFGIEGIARVRYDVSVMRGAIRLRG